MAYILLGIISFLLFLLSDLNMVIFKLRRLNYFFFLGVILLIISTGGIISQSIIAWDGIKTLVFLLITLVFLILLVYTLFFAIPFKESYFENPNSPQVCQRGFYALCRHPGILWFSGFYFFLWLTINNPLLFWAGLVFSFLNLIYALIQDRWTFMKIFNNYPEYKIKTPFIIPDFKSIEHCLRTLREKEENR